jgi:hypothetical protein
VQPGGVGSKSDPGRWTHEFRRWFEAYMADADPRLLERLWEAAQDAREHAQTLVFTCSSLPETEAKHPRALQWPLRATCTITHALSELRQAVFVASSGNVSRLGRASRKRSLTAADRFPA